jgi:hypothetical protein
MRWFAARNQPTIEPPYGVDAKDRAVYADSAYPNKAHTQWLAQRGIEDRMIARAYRNKPLTDVQKAQKPLVGWHALHAWHFKTALRHGLMLLGYNMKRGLNLLHESVASIRLLRMKCVKQVFLVVIRDFCFGRKKFEQKINFKMWFLYFSLACSGCTGFLFMLYFLCF